MPTEAPAKSIDEVVNGIYSTITPKEKSEFEKHLGYRTPESRNKMRYDKFRDNDVGTEKLFDDVYHSAYKLANEKKLKEKTDQESLASSLEIVIIDALKKVGGHAKTAAEIFEAAKGKLDAPERIAKLHSHAAQYLGVGQEHLTKLMAGLRAGDPLVWNQSMREFTNALKDTVIEQYISEHLDSITKDGGHKLTAYMFKEYLPKLNVKPEHPEEEIFRGHHHILAKTDQVYAGRNPHLLKRMGYKDIGQASHN